MQYVGGDVTDFAPVASALDWWRDAGVDTLVDEVPSGWLDRARRRVPTPAPEPPAIARLPEHIDGFRAWLAEAADLPFGSPSSRRVLPAGDPASGLMIVAGMPGPEDIAEGSPIGGEAGRLFDRMLAAIGRNRDSVYIATLSCHRAPSGQFDAGGAERCAELARRHIGLVAPRALLLFGDAPARTLLGTPLVQARGAWREVEAGGVRVPAIATFAPDTLLKQPALKRGAWADLQRFSEKCA